MSISYKLDQIHAYVKYNRWFRYFAIFNRIALAAGFLPAGMVKLMGERFTSLSVNHPMGHYLEALFHTGYYYPFIGVLQVLAALMLLIPRTSTIGALLYFPIILNICVLSFAVRFDGSLFTSPFMVLGNLYLLCWDYDKLKYIFLRNRSVIPPTISQSVIPNNKFPIKFFVGVATTVITLVLIISNMYDLMPHNTLADCKRQCGTSKNPDACNVFCDCIHNKGQELDKSLDNYHNALKNTLRRK